MNSLTKYRKWMAITKESQEYRDHDNWLGAVQEAAASFFPEPIADPAHQVVVISADISHTIMSTGSHYAGRSRRIEQGDHISHRGAGTVKPVRQKLFAEITFHDLSFD
ncbi:hypothetical protein [Pukyongiella litopenaei]|uniref:hypothetical protein n=1 Tax=Pukyongiella litopenaei TaxID=2605946 RepID=UPI001FCE305D|nr:hypothetical protein [Pukyongiella litopenaei]